MKKSVISQKCWGAKTLRYGSRLCVAAFLAAFALPASLLAVEGLGEGGKNGASYDVNSPAAGPFLLTVECANVSEKWQRLKLSVNGKESLFNVEPTGSDQVARQLQEMVYLKAGDNRVEVYTTEGDKRALRIGAVAVK